MPSDTNPRSERQDFSRLPTLIPGKNGVLLMADWYESTISPNRLACRFLLTATFLASLTHLAAEKAMPRPLRSPKPNASHISRRKQAVFPTSEGDPEYRADFRRFDSMTV
jgi:hypothetical protein